MEKEKYTPVRLEILCFACSDIVTSSDGSNTDTGGGAFDGESDEFW